MREGAALTTEREEVGKSTKISVFLTWCKRLVWVFPPIVVLVAMLVTFKVNDLYPFTSKTIAWCDMEQQVIPLMMQFKDVLSGKSGFFFTLKNAGGMNFYGVFFFFLSSPFTFLVAFVEKGEIISFCNVLVMLKMSVCALTASVYFYKKNPNAPLLNVFLSVLYAYSGYTMMYYQNVMWLDVAYLFPLLLLSLERLQEGKKRGFIVVLSAVMVVNYYLGYMVAIFLLLYAFVWTLLSKNKKFAFDFLLCCLVSALITAVVWLPSLWQYLSSGRTTSVIRNLENSSVLTSYQTALPTVFSVLFLCPFAFTQKGTTDKRLRVILLIATGIPLLLEPINKMWQTGSYMSFPTRYAFITIFLCLSLAYEGMTESAGEEGGARKREVKKYIASGILFLLSAGYYFFSRWYTDKNAEIMDQYSQSLWGNTQSFEALASLYVIALSVGVLAFVLWRTHLIKPFLLWLSVGVMVCSELYIAPTTYMLTPAHEVDWHREVVELADKIEDDGFYRVKTDKEYSGRDFDVNLMGGLGYNSLSHYTSLTKQSYMQTIKNFGYTSYWMEVGSSGGTLITDALLSIKYRISDKKTENPVFEGSHFTISQIGQYLPLGVVARRDIIAREKEDLAQTRGEMQNALYRDFFGDEGILKYELSDAEPYNVTVEKEGEKYRLTPTGAGACLRFTLPVEKLSTLYFSAFDENTNALSQAINEKFSVKTTEYFLSSYPTKKRNGILTLGDVAKTVTVTIGVKEQTLVREMSVFAIEKEGISEHIAQTPTLGLTEKKGKITGKYTANGGECVFLSVAYDEGLSLKINGKRADLYPVYGGFTAFYLEEGVNKVEITFCPQGFTGGLLLTILGGALGLWCIWLLKKKGEEKLSLLREIAYYGVLFAGVAVVIVVYLAPMILCAL